MKTLLYYGSDEAKSVNLLDLQILKLSIVLHSNVVEESCNLFKNVENFRKSFFIGNIVLKIIGILRIHLQNYKIFKRQEENKSSKPFLANQKILVGFPIKTV